MALVTQAAILFSKASSGHQNAKLKSYRPNMVRGHKSKKNEVLHDHIHHYWQKSQSLLATRAAIFFNVNNLEIPQFPRGAWELIFYFCYHLKCSNQVRNLASCNLATGLKDFTKLYGVQLVKYRSNGGHLGFGL